MDQGQMRAHCVLFVTPVNLQILQNETFASEILFSLCPCPRCVLRIKPYLRETHRSPVCSQAGTVSHLGCSGRVWQDSVHPAMRKQTRGFYPA